jgi:hypothetical protein
MSDFIQPGDSGWDLFETAPGLDRAPIFGGMFQANTSAGELTVFPCSVNKSRTFTAKRYTGYGGLDQ